MAVRVGESVLCASHGIRYVCRDRIDHLIQHHVHQHVWMLPLLLLREEGRNQAASRERTISVDRVRSESKGWLGTRLAG